MTNSHKSLMVDMVGAVDCAALEVYLAESALASQLTAIWPFIKIDQTTRNGP